MMFIRDFSQPTREQLLPKLKFVPPPPSKVRRVEGQPLATIPREARPSLKVTWHRPPEEKRAGDKTSCMEESAPAQPLTPALSPEYRGEGELQDPLCTATEELCNESQEMC